MDTLIKLQPASHVDNIVDGHEMTQLPYPFFVHEDGSVENGDVVRASRVYGFQEDLAVQQVDLRWADVVEDPQLAVGKYLISVYKGDIGVHQVAIASVEVLKSVNSTKD